MATLRLASDTHLEGFYSYSLSKLVELFLPPHPKDKDSVLILAGDISSKPDQLVSFISAVESRFKKVIYTNGNHELYRQELHDWVDSTAATFKNRLKNTLFALEETEEFVLDDVRFVVSPLWGDGGFTKAEKYNIDWMLNDFRLIQIENRFYTVDDMIEAYNHNKKCINNILCNPFDGKTVVVTHHLPSRKLVSKRYLKPNDDGINGGFVGDCDDLLVKYSPDLWLFGHTHDTKDLMIHNTRCVCNPAGYRSEWATNFNQFMEKTEDFQLLTLPKFIEC